MKRVFHRLWKDDSGVSATEYGIIAAIIAVGLIAVLFSFKGSLIGMFKKAKGAIDKN